MTEIEKKALALVNEVTGHNWEPRESAGLPYFKTLCRAIEQHEAFKREVSDAMEQFRAVLEKGWCTGPKIFDANLSRFVIPKPDPLVEAMNEMGFGLSKTAADELREALAARGLEIREIEQ